MGIAGSNITASVHEALKSVPSRWILALYNLFITLENLALAETYAGKSSFAAGTSVIAAFLAVAEDCVFFRNWSQAFNWQQKLICFLEAKDSWIQYCGPMSV